MSYIGILNLDDSIKKRTFDNNQLCFLSNEQCGTVDDIFSLEYGGEIRHYKIMDVWFAPRDFTIKFLWRLCGFKNKDELQESLEKEFAHIFLQIPWNKIQNMVTS
jgi:hypothetical protein